MLRAILHQGCTNLFDKFKILTYIIELLRYWARAQYARISALFHTRLGIRLFGASQMRQIQRMHNL